MLDARHRRWVIVLTAIGSVMAAIDTLVVTTAIPTIRTDLHASLPELEWTVNAYNLSLAVLLVPAAVLGDRLGRARCYAAGLVLFALASVGAALSTGAGTLIAMRTVQGAGAALLLTLGLALLTGAFPPERRGEAVGAYSAVTGIAVACGPFIGGVVLSGLDWQWIFWVNVPIGLVAVPLVLRLVPEVKVADSTLDLPGVLLLAGGCFALVWAMVRSATEGWGAPEVVAMIAAGVVVLGCFVVWERHTERPLIPGALLAKRGFAAGNVAAFMTLAALFSAVFFYGQLLQVAFGDSPLEAGVRLMAWTATLVVVAPFAGKLADRVGERPLLTAGLAIQAGSFLWLAATVDSAQGYADVVAPFVLGGIGVSMAIPCGQSAVIGAVEDRDVGTASGVNATMRELGGVFGVALSVALFGAYGGYGSVPEFVDGFAAAMAAAAVLSIVGAVAGLALPARRRTVVPANVAVAS
ncbi:DHA2 family efflux MFS transporter permease subunit [Nocardioides sp. MAH-18]|uniref:DHA2 family efflux MFS transporter permease subunit n=1 Tax=Nocardioides agri TaxID=2682843 RepID=A0A6L6XWG3_9ACTN|nr:MULTISPECIES: MFS transporter [unclassified Nocardioides]MBA2952571.1 DHA2 family efflux MFS transporter permease subunit [Nocardioides sp. CGMCC 1.13656]MVQ51734.1 DHA2 family efflux MFS transporter permease subunit [Nocardioides sp. MAH-18]